MRFQNLPVRNDSSQPHVLSFRNPVVKRWTFPKVFSHISMLSTN